MFAKGFDTNTKLTYEKALEFKKKGYDFVVRYVGRLKKSTVDIDHAEIKNILDAGLKLALVQHCPPKPGIFPSKETGALWGRNAATFAEDAGYEEKCILYLDLEDVNPEYSKRQQDIIDFCNAWYDEVNKAGYTPGIYIGFNTFLTGDQLFNSLKFQHYWRSFSKVPDIPKRGYEMFQLKWITECGIQIDTNEMTGDKLGNEPVFMVKKAEPVVSKDPTWQEIIAKAKTDTPVVVWENAINVAIKAAQADGDLGALEIFKFLPDLIVKIYNSK